MGQNETFAAQMTAALQAAQGPSAAAQAEASARNDVLTKPPGALGRLEDLATWYASWRGDARPEIKAPQVIIFAGNHGVVAPGDFGVPARGDRADGCEL